MTLDSAARCSAEELVVGSDVASVGAELQGRIAIDGPGSELRVDRDIVLGRRGVGVLAVDQGNVVTVGGDAILGRFQTGNTADRSGPRYSLGVAQFWGATSFEVAGDLIVGHDGLGAVSLGKGATATCRGLVIGGGRGLGSVEVEDAELTVLGGDVLVGAADDIVPIRWERYVRANALSVSGSGVVDVGGGEIRIEAGAEGLSVDGTVKAGGLRSWGSVRGSGILDVPFFHNDGDFGASRKAPLLKGDYVQSSSGEIVAWPPAPGTPDSASGVLRVTGDATLDGTVHVYDYWLLQPAGTRVELMAVDGAVQGTLQVVADLGTWTLDIVPGTAGTPTRLFVEAQ